MSAAGANSQMTANMLPAYSNAVQGAGQGTAAIFGGINQGLAPINVSEGTLISYATKDGQTADDGVGQVNSPYTTALLEHLGDPDDIAVVLRTVRAKVMQRTNNRQQPWEYGSLTGGALVLSTIKPTEGKRAMPQ